MEERLGRIIAMTGKVVREHFDRDLMTVGSSLNTYVVLRTAAHWPGVSQRQLATSLGIEGPTLTHHLDRLAADGLIKRARNPSDRRVSYVELTPAGRTHLDRVETHAQMRDQEFRAMFTPEEAATLVSLLNRIRDHFMEEADVNAAG
ncbi:MAG: MarR family transcriptional regulator, transcriptional regulator for hemolysin [Acidimicrobiaceae bacterium]|nr:MarR family transcriptional regulator, transcriptional regulator for hemolysin [Acidimicrobiaceae bacterium]